MTRALAHRGPDGEGVLVDGAAALGNRRLAVIDPSPAGAQPMTTEDGRLTVTFNGEIYNFRELRTELERAGRRFRSGADTEVVLQAYAEWGEASVERFNGMFALAIWDARERRLFVARDRYGIKPLYMARVGESLLFASEIKAFLAHPGFRVEPSLPHLLEYLTFQNVFSDGTLFRGVQMVPPGHRWSLASDGAAPAERAVLGLPLRRGGRRGGGRARVRGGAGPALPRGCRAAARERRTGRLVPVGRDGLGEHRRDRDANAPGNADVHDRLRPQLGVRPRARLRRAVEGRSALVPVRRPSSTRWC